MPFNWRRTSVSIAPALDEVECDHRLMFRFGERPRTVDPCGFTFSCVTASKVEKWRPIESELVGLALEIDFLCPILEPICFTVATEEEVELDRDSLRLTVGGRVGTFIVAVKSWTIHQY